MRDQSQDRDRERVHRAALVSRRRPPPAGGHLLAARAGRTPIEPSLRGGRKFFLLRVIDTVEQNAFFVQSALRRCPICADVGHPVRGRGQAGSAPVFRQPRIVEQIVVQFIFLAGPGQQSGGDDLADVFNDRLAKALFAGQVIRRVGTRKVFHCAGMQLVDEAREVAVVVHYPIVAQVIFTMVEHVPARLFFLLCRAVFAGKLNIEQHRIPGLVKTGRLPGAASVRLCQQPRVGRSAKIENMIDVAKAFARDREGFGIAGHPMTGHLRPKQPAGRPQRVLAVIPLGHGRFGRGRAPDRVENLIQIGMKRFAFLQRPTRVELGMADDQAPGAARNLKDLLKIVFCAFRQHSRRSVGAMGIGRLAGVLGGKSEA